MFWKKIISFYFLQRVNKILALFIYIWKKKKSLFSESLDIQNWLYSCLVAEKLNERRGEEKAELSMLWKK